jgi:hypothetical protein
MKTRFVLTLTIVFAWACFSVPVAPCRADKEPAPSLDDQLMKSLGIDSLDEFERELFTPDKGNREGRETPGQRPGIPGGDPDEWKRELLEELGSAGVSEEENPLLDIARQMRQAQGLIAASESGDPTQAVQREIVTRLEELIKQCKSCCKPCNPSQCSPKVAARQKLGPPKKKPGKGRGKPTQKRVNNPNTLPGKAEPSVLTKDQMRELIKSVWGELPASEREQMLERAGDAFLPKYQLLIELYFKRLIEEGRGSDEG